MVIGCPKGQVFLTEPGDLLLQPFIFPTHGLGLLFKPGDFGLEIFYVPLLSFSEGTLSVKRSASLAIYLERLLLEVAKRLRCPVL
jgi:hypothetical protein